ncbi:uncharacterized protein LOC108911116 [Anoplophora glabripennis]|uniref:uncharacterized protein LOC108911116 n=1 Tax=Anoplophora glabripennis TaxID=217634 RepID=UPI000874B33F|nr:uncharacterized protein LOC108911116 [Anoplophora glabripennis]
MMMHVQIALFAAVSALLYFTVFSQTSSLSCNGPDPCKNANLLCPGIVIICRGPNQEIRPTGPCNCCRDCFNISQVGGPCGPSEPRFKCAKGLKCSDDVCKNP